MNHKKSLAVFASGNGSNFEAIARACREERINATVSLLVCDKPGAFVEKRAEKENVKVLSLDPKKFPSKKIYEETILEKLKENDVEFICLAGYMRIIGPTLLEAYKRKILNIHPSLLPSFPGVDAIGQALSYGVKVYGVTVHYVDETLDGGEIIAQAAIPYDGKDREELEAMIHAREHALYVSVLRNLFENKSF